jgi:hypothetical protein
MAQKGLIASFFFCSFQLLPDNLAHGYAAAAGCLYEPLGKILGYPKRNCITHLSAS